MTHFKIGFDLFILKICGLYVKGLQSYCPSNFENDPTLGKLESWPNTIAHNSAGMAAAADFFLRLPTLTASNFAALGPTDPQFSAFKHLNLFKSTPKIKRLAAF